ncbi:MAG TPA: hypothetical protein VN420_04285 [Candidatus Fimivivens sp.]|nr:hypothetical protein [Candidatus Fimivivens sp.]
MTTTASRLKIADRIFFIGGAILLLVLALVHPAPTFLDAIAAFCFSLPPIIHIIIRLGFGIKDSLGHVWHKYAIATLGILAILKLAHIF